MILLNHIQLQFGEKFLVVQKVFVKNHFSCFTSIFCLNCSYPNVNFSTLKHKSKKCIRQFQISTLANYKDKCPKVELLTGSDHIFSCVWASPQADTLMNNKRCNKCRTSSTSIYCRSHSGRHSEETRASIKNLNFIFLMHKDRTVIWDIFLPKRKLTGIMMSITQNDDPAS